MKRKLIILAMATCLIAGCESMIARQGLDLGQKADITQADINAERTAMVETQAFQAMEAKLSAATTDADRKQILVTYNLQTQYLRYLAVQDERVAELRDLESMALKSRSGNLNLVFKQGCQAVSDSIHSARMAWSAASQPAK